MNTQTTTSHIHTSRLQYVLFIALCLLAVTLFGLYVFFLNGAVRNVVMREKLDKESESLAIAVSELEFTYMKQKGEITLDKAHALGFVDHNDASYLTRGALGKGLTLRNEL